MQDSNIPTKFPIPFANAAGGGFVRPIPQASQIGIHDGWASLTDGFVPLNFQAVSAGGVPPFGQDVNGILFQITSWLRWYGAGGPITYDAAYSTAIGGYPRGAIVGSATAFGAQWISTAENNTTNPDTGGAGWAQVNSGAGQYAVDTGTPNVLAIAPPAGITAYAAGEVFFVSPANANTAAATLNVNGLGAVAIVNPDGTALLGGEIAPGVIMLVVYRAGSFQWINSPGGVRNLLAAAGAYFTDGGAVNAISIGPSPLLPVRNGLAYWIKPVATNTAAVTLNATGSALPLVRSDAAALQPGDIVVGQVFRATYDTAISKWRVAGPVASQLVGSGLKPNAAGAVAVDIDGLAAKTIPAGPDEIMLYDVAGGGVLKKATLANVITAISITDFLDSEIFFKGMF